MSILAGFAVPHPPLIIHEVGRGEEKGIQDTIDAYIQVARRVAELKPDTIVVSSPHAPAYYDAFAIAPGPTLHGDMAQFRARKVRVDADIDTELVDRILDVTNDAKFRVSSTAWRGKPMDYAALIPLHFVEKFYHDYKLVEVGLSGFSAQDHFRLGQVIANCANDLGRRVVWIASGDMSHKLTEDGPYGFNPAGPKFDAAVCKIFKSGDLHKLFSLDPQMCEDAAYCGLPSWEMMAGALDGTQYSGKLLSYEGPFGVGYGVAAFEVAGNQAAGSESAAESAASNKASDTASGDGSNAAAPKVTDPYVSLAISAVDAYVKHRDHLPVPDGLPAEMTEKRAGTFVSIHEDGELRGCIGTLQPYRKNIAEEIIGNAISACSQDPRFPAVREEELPHLDYSVDVLSPSQPCEAAELDPKHFGVIVSKGMRRGVLLPNLDGVDTVAEQVAIAKQKAGIAPSESCNLEKFTVVRHYPDHAEQI